MTPHEKAVMDLADALDQYHIALANWVDAHNALRQAQTKYADDNMALSQINQLTERELENDQFARHRLTSALLLVLVRYVNHVKGDQPDEIQDLV